MAWVDINEISSSLAAVLRPEMMTAEYLSGDPSANNFRTPGLFHCYFSEGLPGTTGWQDGIIEVFKKGNYTYQRIMNTHGGMAIRFAYSTENFSDWKILG